MSFLSGQRRRRPVCLDDHVDDAPGAYRDAGPDLVPGRRLDPCFLRIHDDFHCGNGPGTGPARFGGSSFLRPRRRKSPAGHARRIGSDYRHPRRLRCIPQCIAFFDVGLLMAAIVILHNVFGLALGYGMAKLFRLDSRKSRTVAIEVGMQNSGMAASLAVLYFNPAAAIPGAIFSVWHNISGSIVANFFSRRDEKAEEKARALSVDKSSVPTH